MKNRYRREKDSREENFQWQVLLDEADWNRDVSMGGLDQPGNAPERRSGLDGPFLTVVLGLALLAGLGGLWLWQQAQAGLANTEAELAEAAALETWAEAGGRADLSNTLLDSSADESWRAELPRAQLPLLAALDAPASVTPDTAIEIEFIDLREDVAQAQVLVKDDRLPLIYRETRFYRDTGAGWLRTSPGRVFFGEDQKLDSAHFTFIFPARDRETVEAIAPRLDDLHERIWQSLSQPVRTPATRRRIEVRPSSRPDVADDSRTPNGTIVVPSPSLLIRPADLTEEELLYEYVAIELIHRITWTRSRELARPWRSARRGLRLWLLWDMQGNLSAWRQPILYWLYRERVGLPVQEMADTPARYPELCQTFWSWHLRPYYVGIPLTCDQGERLLFKPVRMATRLRHLSIPNNDYWEELVPDSSRYPPGSPVSAAMLFDYVAATYGRESVALFLDQTSEYFRWEDIIPATFGTTPEEFEAGWQAHINRLIDQP